MTKTFTHTFRNGQTITLTWDLSKDMPLGRSGFDSMELLAKNKKVKKEFLKWRDEVVFPEIMPLLTKEQHENTVNWMWERIFNKMY